MPASLLAQAAPEQALALVLRAEGAQLLRAGTALGLTAHPGDLLFAGDSLQAEQGSAAFLFCPESSEQTIAGGAVVIGPALKAAGGQLSVTKKVAHCYLPRIPRAAASQMHNGASLARAMNPGSEAGTFEARAGQLEAAAQSALKKELEPLDQALAADPGDFAARLARAGVLEKYKLAFDAAEEYKKLSASLPDAVWVKTRLFTLEEEAQSARGGEGGAAEGGGRTVALLVGISKFQSTAIRPLNFAHEDARLMESYLRSARGGNLEAGGIVVLDNEKATTAAIRNNFETFLKTAGKNDTVILLLASHGTVVETQGKRGAYIVTYDSDPEDLEATALPMGDVQKLIREDLSKVGRVMAFVDVCRAGTIGTIPRNAKVNSVVERLAEADGELFLFTASRANEFSFEGPQYGGGHGAFSFFLLEALNGPGDLDNDSKITINELIEYTQTKVAEGTANRQHPREAGAYDGANPVADATRQGIAMKKFIPRPEGGERLAAAEQAGSRSLERTAAGARPRASVLREQVDFEESLEAGRILPDSERSAFTALRQYQRRVKPPEYLLQANRLKTELENRGQQVLLRYLRGDQTPQTRTEFSAGAAYFEAARLLTPESVHLEARSTFFLGRVKIFDKDYAGATLLLERAARLDPEGAYSYNALGIAALEQAAYERAGQAFREAMRLAPYWAYPRHNLALARMQMGDYEGAIESYREAMRLAPRYSYLPYNLGLIYQRMNRGRDAERSYRKAIELDPDGPMGYNAMGYLKASQGKRQDAERYYKLALAKDAGMAEARHNLAVLYAGERKRAPEAIETWRRLLKDRPDYLPARLSLAKALEARGEGDAAVAEYREVTRLRPDYAAAREALAGLLLKSGDRDGALRELREAAQPQSFAPHLWERIGDLESAAGRAREASAAYEKALEQATDGGTRKRIRGKMGR